MEAKQTTRQNYDSDEEQGGTEERLTERGRGRREGVCVSGGEGGRGWGAGGGWVRKSNWV